MSARLSTVLVLLRGGSRVVRYLIRPARRRLAVNPGAWGRDPWLVSGDVAGRVQRGLSLTRRGLGLGVLLVLAVLGALLLLPLLLVLGVGAASGSDVAGWFLGVVLLLGVLGAVWTAWRAKFLLQAQVVSDASSEVALPEQQAEVALLRTLRAHERALPSSARTAFHATVIATRDALRASAQEETLTREGFDVRQAAREDIPELLATYQAGPRTPDSELELRRQLQLIEDRMQGVVQRRAAQQQRALQAHGRYLEKKYNSEE